MNEARARILARLRRQGPRPAPAADDPVPPPSCDLEACVARFSERMQAVRGEVHRLRDRDWQSWLQTELPRRGVRTLLHGTGRVGRALAERPPPGVALRPYDRPVDAWKPALFQEVDAGISGSRGAIAETGSLILWPDREEPRLLSLVSPLHIVLLEAGRIHPTLEAAMRAEDWARGMPTNALLISGPSKTADIEQTLAYGIHGPRALITLILG